MGRMIQVLRRLWMEEEGQDLIEYVMLVAFLAVAVSVFLPPTIAPAISGIFSRITTLLAKT